jgi:photosystem II stability/assembly factor-like uncharacterized protein
MKKLLLALLVLFTFSQTYAQWFYQNPVPTGNRILQVRFSPAVTGMAVGEFGTIIRTTDGGSTWTQCASRTSAHLYDFWFTGPDQGFAVGDHGTVLVTSDGGQTWNPQDLFPGVSPKPVITSVYFADADHGFLGMSNGGILRTTDGGFTWPDTCTSGGSSVNEFHFTTPASGIAMLDDLFKITADGGQTWSTQPFPQGTQLLDMDFPNPDTGYIVASDGIYRTLSAGQEWALMSPLPGAGITAVSFSSGLHGWTGSDQASYHTCDGGATWCRTDLPDPSPGLTAMCFTDPNTGYRAGNKGYLGKTTDGGLTWNSLQADCDPDGQATDDLTGIHMVNTQTGYATNGSGKIYRTVNGGQEWSLVSDSITSGGSRNPIWFTDPQTGYLGINGGVVKTSDGGEHWAHILVAPASAFTGLFFSDPNTGFVIQDGTNLLRTTDAGDTWTELQTLAPSSMNRVFFADASAGYVSGAGGMVIRTTDGGLTWSAPLPTGVTDDITDLAFPTPERGFAITEGLTLFTTSRIIATADGGQNWTPVEHHVPGGVFYSVDFPDPLTGYITGEGFTEASGTFGVILKSSDGGATWVRQESPGAYPLYDASFPTAGDGWACGMDEIILHTSNGGVIGIPEPVPGPPSATLRFAPNPFRDQVTIYYTLPSPASVQATLFNSLGQPVLTMSPGPREPGPHSLTLSPRSLTPGVYYCRLSGEGYSAAGIVVKMD